MGINGLLPFLEKASKPVNISEFKGCTVAVDTYCWLHKGAFSCADKLARGEQTDQYIYYCLKFVNMLLSHNIKPILVFDGRHLPAKAETEKVRKERREMNRKKAAELLRADRVDEAKNLIRRCVDVTHEMASALMERCHAMGVDCIVAPYEADAQLAFFSLTGVAHLVITEDSDLLLFGCKKVIFKMDPCGNGLLVDQTLIPLAMKQPSDQFSLDKFRYMCILSGCDYLASLPGIGLAKSCKFIKRTTDSDIYRALSRLGPYLNMNNLVVTEEYKNKFMVALSMFKHQPVFDPFKCCLTTLTPLPEHEPLPVDEGLSPDTIYQLALGNLNPFTLKKTGNWDPGDVKNFKTTSWNSKAIKNSIWSKDYQSKEFIPKKNCSKFDGFTTTVVNPKTPTVKKKCIEEPSSPKKYNEEAELNSLRNIYGIKLPAENSSNVLKEVGNFDLTNEDFDECDVNVDDLLEDVCNVKMKNSTKGKSKNPFAKTNLDKNNQLTPLCSALSRMSRLSSASMNGSNGEVSRFFSNEWTVKEDALLPMAVVSKEETDSPQLEKSTLIPNKLKDTLNTEISLNPSEVICKTIETPTKSRRNVFSTSPHNVINNPTSPHTRNSSSRPSFLGMLDTLAGLREEQNETPSKEKEIIKKPTTKKQIKLSFNDNTLLPGAIAPDLNDSENAEPVKLTACVKTLPASDGTFQTKRELPSRLFSSPKLSFSPKLGPAKTIGLKRKKCSSANDSKTSQPSIFEMFAFQPKAKLKMQ